MKVDNSWDINADPFHQLLGLTLEETREGTQPAGTADLQITYLRQAHGKWIDAEANVIKRGRQLCTIHVDIMSEDGTLCANGRVLYALRS
ncbi:MAG: PaaI family thioesterase [Pseudomonadales bacterium]|nr:PaaI family thioesterase [Pseudomonadales bacterium]